MRSPDSEICLLVENCFLDVARLLPDVDRLIQVRLEDILLCFDRANVRNEAEGLRYYRELVANLQSEQFDEVWNLTHTRPFTVLSSLVGGVEAKGVTLDRGGLQTVNEPWLRYFYATNLARPWCQFNLVDIYANCIRGLPPLAGRELSLNSDLYSKRFPKEYTPRYARKRIAIHPGASQQSKQWSVDAFADAAKRLLEIGYEATLIGGKSDMRLAESFPRHPALQDMIGRTNIPELAAVLRDSDLLISNDSGPMHMAAAVGTTVIAITLGSALGSETAPYGEAHWVVEPHINCFPCDTEQECSHRRCGNYITPEQITKIAVCQIESDPLPSEIEQNNQIRLYRTAMDTVNGQLKLNRQGYHPNDSRDTYQELLYRLWPGWLYGENSVHDLDDLQIPESFRTSVMHTVGLAKEAKACCNELARLDGTSNQTGTTADRLLRIEQQLYTTMKLVPVLRSILAYLQIEKGSIRGTNLQQQARETAASYLSLQRMLQPVAELVQATAQIETIQ